MWKIAIEKRGVLGVVLGAALLSAAPVSIHWSAGTAPSVSFDRADARVGQPLSPGSVAGVNRRVNRRTARRAGAVAAAGVAGVGAGEDTGHSSYYGGGYNGLYSSAPAASVAPAANTTTTNTAASSAPASSAPPPIAPELYASCLIRNFGACPGQ